MSYTPLHGMPAHELLQRAKAQGIWPLNEIYHDMSLEDILKGLSYDTGHKIKYLRAVLKACAQCDPSNWPSLYVKGERVKVDLTAHGQGKFKNKPNPVVRKGIARAASERERIIQANDKVSIRHTAAPDMRTNAGQLERAKAQYAPVLTNGRMRKHSKSTTSFSTGFAPPSRKDDTRVKVKQTGVYKRFSSK